MSYRSLRVISLALLAGACASLFVRVSEFVHTTLARYVGVEALRDASIPLFLLLAFVGLWFLRSAIAWARLYCVQILLLVYVITIATAFIIRPDAIHQIGLTVVVFGFLSFVFRDYLKTPVLRPTIEAIRGVDDPVQDPKSDRLGRAAFAKSLFKLVKQRPNDPMRILVTGDWGSGKTTCLNFVRAYAERNGYPVAFFSSWQFRNTDAAWAGFIAAIDAGIAKWRGIPIGPFRRHSLFVQFLRIAVKILPQSINSHSIGLLFDDLIQARLTSSLEATKERVSRTLRVELQNKPLIFFIDDLDRSKEEVIYDLLVFIKEVIDVRQCVFICAVDVEATQRALRGRLGDADVLVFLEKIFQWLLPLSPPTINQHELLIDGELKHIEAFAKKQLLEKHKSLLPANPRRLKLFLRHIVNIHILLERFSDEDLNWAVVYLAELLKFSFRETAERLFKDQSFVKWLIVGRMMERELEEPQAWRKIIDDNPPKESAGGRAHFELIVQALAEACTFMPEEQLHNQLRVLSHPEVLTWKEYRRWYRVFKRYQSADSVRRALLDNRVPIERRREFIRALIRERNSELTKESEAVLQADRDIHIAKALALTDDAMFLVKIEQIFVGDSPPFDKGVIKEWLSCLVAWSNFDAPFYEQIRKLERRIVLLLARNSRDQAAAMLEQLGDMRDLSREHRSKYQRLVARVFRIWKSSLAEQLVGRFEVKDGIRSLWPKSVAEYEKALLFNPNRFFHNERIHRRLEALAERASVDSTIQKNFVEYIGMLMFAAFQNKGYFDNDGAIALLLDHGFREMLWMAATSRRIHRRSMGDLLDQRRSFIQRTHLVDALPVPDWVTRDEPGLVEHFPIGEA